MSRGGGGPRRRVSSMGTKCTRGAVPRLLGPLNPHEEEGEEPIRLHGAFFGKGSEGPEEPLCRPLVAAVAEAEALHLRARPARVWTKELRCAVLHVLLDQQSAREHANTETEKKKKNCEKRLRCSCHKATMELQKATWVLKRDGRSGETARKTASGGRAMDLLRAER